MTKFNLPKPAIFKPTKSLHSTGAFGGGGGGGDVTNNYFYSAGINYAFSTSTNPAVGATPGFFCFNNATVGSITKCYVAKLGNDSQNWTATLALMTSGVLNVYEGATGGLTTFTITGVVEQADWFEFDVAHKGGALPASQGCYLGFVPGVSLQQLRGPLITESGTTRTLALTDADKFILCTNSGAVSITVPPQSSVAWDDNTVICIEQDGTGQVTIVAGSGVTIQTSQTLKTAFRYAPVVLRRVGSDDWRLYGERELA